VSYTRHKYTAIYKSVNINKEILLTPKSNEQQQLPCHTKNVSDMNSHILVIQVKECFS
jgi:hypothetical protein